MVTTLNNEEGLIYAYVDWAINNDKGELDLNGDTVYIYGIWVHEKYRHKKALENLIVAIFSHPRSQNCEYVRYHREKYSDRCSGKQPIYKYIKQTSLRQYMER